MEIKIVVIVLGIILLLALLKLVFGKIIKPLFIPIVCFSLGIASYHYYPDVFGQAFQKKNYSFIEKIKT